MKDVTASVVKVCDEDGRQKQLTFPLTHATDTTDITNTLIKKTERRSAQCHRYTCQGTTGLDLLIGMSPLTPLICQ
jgi:hypothetical protein